MDWWDVQWQIFTRQCAYDVPLTYPSAFTQQDYPLDILLRALGYPFPQYSLQSQISARPALATGRVYEPT